MRESSAMRKSVKRALGLGVLGGAAYAAWRAWNAQQTGRPRGVEWSSAPFPFPPAPRPTFETMGTSVVTEPAPAKAPEKPKPVAKEAKPWVEPKADGTCPKSHPIKAKLSSGIFHSPGGANYERTKPDRCYRDAEAALADGLRAAKA